MFKGIAALFSSGVIFNPLVLLGILSGFFFAFKLPPEVIEDVYKNYHFYLLAALLSFLYNFFFNKTYTEGGVKIDRSQMILNMIFGTVKFLAANILTISFVSMLSF